MEFGHMGKVRFGRRNQRCSLPITPPWGVRKILPFRICFLAYTKYLCDFSEGFRKRRMRKMGMVQGSRSFYLITC